MDPGGVNRLRLMATGALSQVNAAAGLQSGRRIGLLEDDGAGSAH